MKEKDISFLDLFLPLTTKKVCIYIFLIGICVFFNALFNEFVWDDLSYIQFNPDVHTVNIVSLFKENSFNDPNGQYRALTATYFAILYALFKNSTFFYHSIQLLMHIGNTILLFFLLRKFISIHISFFLVLVFLVHPIQVESVSFIGAAGNVLLFFFGITALVFFHIKVFRNNILLAFPIFFLLLFSLLAKETGVVFLLLSMISPFLFHWSKKVTLLISGVGILGVYFFIRFFVGGIFFNSEPLKSVIPITNLTLSERLLNIPAIFFYYLKTLVFPTTLVIDQLWVISAVDIPQFYLPLIIDILFIFCCIALGVYIYKHKRENIRGFLFFTLWFVLGMLIHLQIVPLDMTVADRWFYVPFAGLLGMIGIGLSSFQMRTYGKAAGILAVIIICLFSLRTIIRNTNWTNNLTLFSHDAKLIDNFEMENNLATFYYLERKPKEALVHAQKSVTLYPNETNLTNLAFIYENERAFKKAEEYYKKAIHLQEKTGSTRSAFAYLRLGGLYLFNGEPQKAVTIYNSGIEKYPDDEVLWSFLAASYYELGNHTNALAAAKKAKEINPTLSIQNLYNLILNKKTFDVRKL